MSTFFYVLAFIWLVLSTISDLSQLLLNKYEKVTFTPRAWPIVIDVIALLVIFFH